MFRHRVVPAFTAIVMIALLALTACTGGARTPTGGTETASIEPGHIFGHADGALHDPACDASAAVVAGPLLVLSKTGSEFGQLELLQSSDCETMWAQVTGIQSDHMATVAVIGLDDNSPPFEITRERGPDGSILSKMARYDSRRCIKAEAFVVDSGEKAVTECISGNG